MAEPKQLRELHVVGLDVVAPAPVDPDAPDAAQADSPQPGTYLIVADAAGERFRILADDRLRAAARGDLPRLGQLEVEAASSMSPKEIQQRIRAGATIEQVAAQAGTSPSRVERFAYPVMLERERAAELAQGGHPVRFDGPAVATLGDIVAQAFAERGHSLAAATWDAWRDDQHQWVAQLQWTVGRTVVSAHWRYQPDAHGGTIIALDDPARDLVDPDYGRALRGVAAVDPLDTSIPLPEADDAPVVADAPADSAPATPAEHHPKGKRGKPSLPSWDDVLLGVRAAGHDDIRRLS